VSSSRSAALVAGILYLSTHVTSVAAVAAYGDGTSASGVVGGVALEVLLALGVLGTGVVLLPLLSPAAPVLANAFSSLRTMEAAVIAAGTLPMLALPARPTDAGPLLALHDAAFLVGQGLIISVNTLVIATLLVRTGVVPRWIGILGLVGGVLVLFGNTGQLVGWFDRTSAWAAIAAVPVFAFEISFAVYLIARGLREPRTVSPLYAARQQPTR
jgi:hypothetical protein